MTLLQFNTEQIADIASETQKHNADWDQVWNTVKAQIASTVSEALDAYTGGSLDERSADYHRKTQQYNAQLQSQAVATAKVGGIATDTNAQMAKTVSA